MRSKFKISWLLASILSGGVVSGQRVGVGVKIGVLASDPFATSLVSVSPAPAFVRSLQYLPGNERLTAGPMIELRLPGKVALEGNVLYRRVQYLSTWRVRDTSTDPFFPFDVTLRIETRARNWEVPFLVKYRFSRKTVRPFVGGGAAVRWVTHVVRNLPTSSGPLPLPASAQSTPSLALNRRWTAGALAAAGVEWRISAIRIAPEIRYTRWASPSFRDAEGGLVSHANQLEVLLGVGF